MKAFAVVLFTVTAACSANWNDPLPVTPIAGNRCGENGVSCRPIAATCCDEGDVCGAGVTCPKDMCCDEGRDDGKFGARPPHPQRPED